MEREKTSSEDTHIHICDIPLKLPSLNEYVNACRANRYAGSKMKRDTERDISWFIRTMPVFDEPVFISFQWREATRRRDADNIAFGKKFILDALVAAGKLKDDSPRYVVGFRDTFDYGSRTNGVRLFIESVSAGKKV